MQNSETLFNLIKVSVYPSSEARVSVEDMTPVYQEFRHQALTALPYFWLKKNYPNENWLKECGRSQANWLKIMLAQDALLKLLDANNIPCVIIKGAAAAMSYPHPSLRAMGDIDFLVKRADYQKAAKLLEDNGYILAHAKNDRLHHYGYHKSGVSFELHRRLGIIKESSEELLRLFEDGIDNREYHTTEGFTFPTLPIALNGLSLIYHINQHLRSGLGLRQIIDWMMYVEKLPDSVWEKDLQPVLEKTGQENLAITVTTMCQNYLGLSADISWCRGANPDTCDELMEYILEKGNFGRKSGEKGKIDSVFLISKNPVYFFKRLQRGGLFRWKAAQKHKILRPFAWVYQIGRIVKELIDNRVKPKDMANSHKDGSRQRKLIKKLGLEVDRSI